MEQRSGDGWQIPVLCLGIALIACCTLIPMADSNRRLAFQREKMKRDLAHLHEQIRVNDDFLTRVSTDPNLSERLAQRQMKLVRQGTGVLTLKNEAKLQTSPFLLVNVPKPPALAAYVPVKGRLARLCRNSHNTLVFLGAGLLMIAAGLVCSSTEEKQGTIP